MKRIWSEDWIKLSPLLILYLVIIVVLYSDKLDGDEVRYLSYAENITNGFYTDAENPELRNAPLYPLILAVFLGLGIPLIVPTILNGFFLFGAVYLIYQTMKRYIKPNQSLFWAYLFGLYPIPLKWIHLTHYEMFSIFLMSAFVFHLTATAKTDSFSRNHIWAGVIWGLIILTKFIFGYVAIVAIIAMTALFVILRKKYYLRIALLFILGFSIALPYVFYTYTLTDKFFYLSTQSGEYLYWMTSPHKGEWGNWVPKGQVYNSKFEELHPSHKEFYESVDHLSAMERNDAFKEKGKEQFREDPLIYVKNWVATQLRLFFNYPISHTQHSLNTYFYIFPNMFLLVFLIISIYPGWVKRDKIPIEFWILVGIVLTYQGGVSLNLGKPRQMLISMPTIMLWLSYIYSNIVKIKLEE